jgi:prophage regulatory protein
VVTMLLRLPDVLSRIGRSRTTLYAEIEADRFPPPIKLGRGSFWRDDEVSSIIDAYCSGAPHEALVRLTAELVERRSTLAPGLARDAGHPAILAHR